MDGIDSRPRSMEGPIDSGVSISGDNVSSPDSDNSSQHIQNQIVSTYLPIKPIQCILFLRSNNGFQVYIKQIRALNT